jgi:hypothetical protein
LSCSWVFCVLLFLDQSTAPFKRCPMVLGWEKVAVQGKKKTVELDSRAMDCVCLCLVVPKKSVLLALP